MAVSRQRVLICSTYYSPYLSGLTLYPERLAAVWRKKGYIVKVLTFQHDPQLPRKELVKGIEVCRLPAHIKISKGLINFKYPLYAWRAVKKSDLVLANLPSFENVITVAFARLQRKPVLALYHCDVEIKNSLINRLASTITNFCSRLTCLMANQIVSSSADYAAASPVIHDLKAKTHFSYPPIEVAKPDVNYQHDLKRWYGKNSPLIGFVGRFSSEKNLETLIEALEILKKDYPKIKLLTVGPFAFQVVGESKYYLKVLQLLEEYGTRYEILGILESRKLAGFLKTIDLLVLPSNNRTEAFGMVQAEAMLLGTPVVAPDSPGIRVPVKKTGMGALFTKGNAKSLAEAIRKVYTTRNKLRKLEPVAKARFGQHKFLLPELQKLTQSA